METSSGANKHALEPPTAQAPPRKHVRCKAYPYPSQTPDQVYVAASATVEIPQPCRPCPKGPPAEFMPTPPEIASMQTDSYEDDRKARLNDKGLYIRVKSNRDIDWSKPLWEQLAPVLKGGPSPSKSYEELRTIRAKVPELTNVLLQWSLSRRQCHHSSPEELWCSQDPHVRTCSMGPQWHTLVQSIATADDDCHMVPQLGGCEQVSILDADIASSLW